MLARWGGGKAGLGGKPCKEMFSMSLRRLRAAKGSREGSGLKAGCPNQSSNQGPRVPCLSMTGLG